MQIVREPSKPAREVLSARVEPHVKRAYLAAAQASAMTLSEYTALVLASGVTALENSKRSC